MNKDVLHEFNLDMYPRKLWIAISTDNFKDTFDEVSEFNDNCNACVEDAYDKVNKKGGVLIRFRNKNAMNVSNIAHESFHAALSVFSYICANIDYDNQEPFAYLVGFIAKCCEDVKKGIKK